MKRFAILSVLNSIRSFSFIAIFASLSVILTVSQAHSAPSCRDVFSETKIVSAPAWENSPVDLHQIFDFDVRTFKRDGAEYPVYKMDSKRFDDPRYRSFLRNTAEVVWVQTTTPYGHIILRLGEKAYAFNAPMRTRFNEPFRLPTARENVRGVVFAIGEEAIQAKISEIEKFYSDSNKYNIPPMDGNGSRLMIEHVTAIGGKFRSMTNPRYAVDAANNMQFAGQVIEEKSASGASRLFLQNPEGTRVRVGRTDQGDLFTQGFSCATSAAEVLREYFGLDLHPSVSARNFVRLLAMGNSGYKTVPSAIILYGPEKLRKPREFMPAGTPLSKISPPAETAESTDEKDKADVEPPLQGQAPGRERLQQLPLSMPPAKENQAGQKGGGWLSLMLKKLFKS